MKYIIIFIILILVGCKNQAKVKMETKIDKSVYEMWDNFTKSNPEFKKEKLPKSDFFHNNEKDANRLAKLIINGKKKASSGLYFNYKESNSDLPKVGEKLIVTDFNGKALAIIETKKVDTIPFNLISKEYAELDMGTDIEPLKKWKKAHWDFFSETMIQKGEKPTEKMLVVCEWFDTVWSKNQD